MGLRWRGCDGQFDHNILAWSFAFLTGTLAPMLKNALVLLASVCVGFGAEKENDWKPLFDGKSTKGWEPRAKVESFEAVEGELHLTSKVNVWVVSDLQLSDFVAELEVKIPQENAGFNSGLGFRLVGDKGKPKGYQCEIDRSKPGGVYGIGMGGWLYPKGKDQTAAYNKTTKGLFKPEEWNHFPVKTYAATS